MRRIYDLDQQNKTRRIMARTCERRLVKGREAQPSRLVRATSNLSETLAKPDHPRRPLVNPLLRRAIHPFGHPPFEHPFLGQHSLDRSFPRFPGPRPPLHRLFCRLPRQLFSHSLLYRDLSHGHPADCHAADCHPADCHSLFSEGFQFYFFH